MMQDEFIFRMGEIFGEANSESYIEDGMPVVVGMSNNFSLDYVTFDISLNLESKQYQFNRHNIVDAEEQIMIDYLIDRKRERELFERCTRDIFFEDFPIRMSCPIQAIYPRTYIDKDFIMYEHYAEIIHDLKGIPDDFIIMNSGNNLSAHRGLITIIINNDLSLS